MAMGYHLPGLADNFNGSSEVTPTTFNREIIDYFLSSGQKGILISVLGDPEFKPNRLQRNFYVNEGAKFTGKILIHSTLEVDAEYTMYCLIDYRQVYFSVDGETDSAHKIKLATGFDRIVNIGLPESKSGRHDVLLFLRRNDVANDNFAEEPPFSILSWRSVLNVGADKLFKEPQYEEITQVDGIEKSRRPLAIKQVNNNCKERCALSVELAILAKPKTDLGLAKYAVVLFNGDNQVSIGLSNDDFPRFFAGRYAKKGVFDIPLKFSGKIDEVWGVIVTNPFEQLEVQGEKLSEVPNEVYVSNVMSVQ